MSNTQTIIDIVNPLPNGIIECRQCTTDDNGSLSYVRWTLNPGQDISEQDSKVQSVCNDTWTPKIIASFNASNNMPIIFGTIS